jgi:dTDP-D-glucose 4,6-dehydratase
LRAALCGEPVQVWGDGNNRIDYIFADDGIASILDLVEVGAWRQIVNVDSCEEHSLNEILEVITETVPNFILRYLGKRSFHTPNFSLDINKLNYLTNQRQLNRYSAGDSANMPMVTRSFYPYIIIAIIGWD